MSTLDENTNGLQQILNTVNELPSGGGGNKSVIIDVTELPTDIDKNAFYRVPKGTFYSFGGVADNWFDCYVVETRPEISETMTEYGTYIFYYALDTGVASVYITDEKASEWGVRSGWWTAEEWFEADDSVYKGVVYDKADLSPDGYNLLLESDLYAGSDKLVKASDEIPVPTFDLYEMGLPIITVEGTETTMNMYGVIDALRTGLARVHFRFGYDYVPYIDITANLSNAYWDEYYEKWICYITLDWDNDSRLTAVLKIGYGSIYTRILAP